MELFQSGGDTPSAKAWDCIRGLADRLGRKLIVKETGCGISREVARKLAGCGVRTLDVAGAGGTSWVRVENLRRAKSQRMLNEFEDWGIPTAASLLECSGLGLDVIAGGGIRTGLDLAKSIRLGACAGSAALPLLRALHRGGTRGVEKCLDEIFAGLRLSMALTGCRTLSQLRRCPAVLTGPLFEWATQRHLWKGLN